MEVQGIQAWLVYGCFLLLGQGTLLPWNFFITAESYWQYKFRNVSLDDHEHHWHNSSSSSDGSGDYTYDGNYSFSGNWSHDYTLEKTQLQKLFTPMQVCLSQFPNFLFLFVNALFSHRLPIKQRLVTSLTAMMIFFTITTCLVKVDSDTWQDGFFALTMVIIVLLNSFGAIFQGGLFGLAGMFPERYMTAVVAGQAIGGVFASTSRLVSLAVGADDITSAFIYFLIAVAVMGATLAAFYYVSSTDLYHHYTVVVPQQQREVEKNQLGGPMEEPVLTAKQLAAQSAAVLTKIWPLGLSVCATFWVTLSVFPAVCVKIVSQYPDTEWADVYFQPVATFLLFNLGDYFGRQIGGAIMWPVRGSKVLYVLVASRLVFIPLFLLCNHTGSDSAVPSVFMNDADYMVIMAAFSISNGYLSTLCMIYGPRYVDDSKDAERAGSVMAAMIGLGLLLGAMSSFGFGMIL